MLASAPVRAARRCGPVAVPTHKLVPLVRWQLDVPADAVVARNDPAAARLRTPGVVLLERTRRLLHDPGYGAFGQQGAGNSPLSAQAPPAGYTHRGHSPLLRDLHAGLLSDDSGMSRVIRPTPQPAVRFAS